MAEVYDGYFYIHRLTPETRPGDATLSRDAFDWLARFDFVRAKEREVLGARRWR